MKKCGCGKEIGLQSCSSAKKTNSEMAMPNMQKKYLGKYKYIYRKFMITNVDNLAVGFRFHL